MAETLSRPPESPPSADPYADHAAIKALVRKAMVEWAKGREAITRAAWRNILFGRGHQWIKFDRWLNRFRPARLPKGTPTPVTNKFASTLDAVISVLARIEPTLNYRPATSDAEDRAAADVAVRAIQVIEDEVNLRVNRQSLATWNGYTGVGWIETGYDPDPIHGTRLLQHEECLACGTRQAPMPEQTCQTCRGRLLMPAMGPGGEPVGEPVPIGRMYADVVPLFEMYFDASVSDWKKQRRLCRKKSVPLDDAKARWPDLAEKLQADSMASAEDFYGESLVTLGAHVDEMTSGRQLLQGQAMRSSNSRVTEEWYWALPDATYPDGLLAVIVGKEHIGTAGPLPYHRRGAEGADVPFLPFAFFPQKLMPGSAWPKTVADDLALKAVQRNQIESLIMKSLMTTANNVWLIPETANVTNFTGEPGQQIRFNNTLPNSEPKRVPGQGLPAGLMLYMEQINQDFEELAGTYDIIKGARPEGVSAGIALQILQERGMSRFGPLFILWEAGWAEWASQAIEIFREYVTEDRLLKIKGRNGQWRVEKFLGADLQGRVDIIAEAGSSLPRSSLTDRAEVEQLIMLGVLSPREPETRFKILEQYGKSNWVESMAMDTENALKENEAFAALGRDPRVNLITPEDIEAMKLLPPETVAAELGKIGLKVPRVRPAVDDHGIHSREIGVWLKSEEGQAQRLAVRLRGVAPRAQHDGYAAQQMQAMMAMQAGVNPTGGFLSNPGGMAGGQQQPMNTSSGLKRMAGDEREMAGMQAGSAVQVP